MELILFAIALMYSAWILLAEITFILKSAPYNHRVTGFHYWIGVFSVLYVVYSLLAKYNYSIWSM